MASPYARKREAERVVPALVALEGSALTDAVRRLLRASRTMMDAFENGDPTVYSSSAMKEALAPFEGFEG